MYVYSSLDVGFSSVPSYVGLRTAWAPPSVTVTGFTAHNGDKHAYIINCKEYRDKRQNYKLIT